MTQDFSSTGTSPQAQLPSLVDPAAVAAAESAKARIQAAYQIAMYKPRSFMQSRKRILDACARPSFAAKVEYAKPVGSGKVRGPSIRFAELALREWQNIMVETQTIYEDDEKRRILIRVLDLETNSTFSKEVQLNKTVERRNGDGREIIRSRQNTNNETVYIVRATEDELLNKEAALVSKAIRNEGLRLIPQDIIEEALEEAKKALRGDAKDPLEAIRKLCDFFANSFRISVEQLETYLGHAVNSATWEELDDLRAIANAIKDGEAKWSDYVQPKEKGDKSAAGTISKGEELKQKLAQAKQTQTIAGNSEQGAGSMIQCPLQKIKINLSDCNGKCPDPNFECSAYKEATT